MLCASSAATGSCPLNGLGGMRAEGLAPGRASPLTRSASRPLHSIGRISPARVSSAEVVARTEVA